MKTTEFEKKDGTKGTKNTLEPGDKIEALFDTIFKGEPRAGVTKEGKPFLTTDYLIKCKYGDKEITVNLTAGQGRKLEKEENLKGKIIEATTYKMEEKFPGQVFTGVKVL